MKLNAISIASIAVSTVLLAAPDPAASQPTTTTSDVLRFSDGGVVGFSILARSEDAIRMQVKTSDLEPGAAYTVWWVIFNFPENCNAGCDLEEIINPMLRAATQVAVGYAAGHVVGNNGKGNFAARLSVGDTSGFGGGTDPAPPPPLGPGLLNPMGAEVHLVIRTHGDPIPGLVDEQIQSFGGGCMINVCEDRQFSVHLPPS